MDVYYAPALGGTPIKILDVGAGGYTLISALVIENVTGAAVESSEIQNIEIFPTACGILQSATASCG